MEEPEGPLDGGGGRAGGRDVLRAHGAVLLSLGGPLAVLLPLAAAVPDGPGAGLRAAFLCFAAFAGAIVAAPLAGAAGRRGGLALAGGGFAALSLAVFATGDAGLADSMACGAVLAAYAALLAGVALAVGRAARRPAAGVATASLLGTLLLGSFHLGDPFLEWGGAGSHSSAVLALLNAVNPAGGTIGRALGIDWLRLPIMYRGFPGSAEGGLSAASYYVFASPPWTWFALVFGGAAVVLFIFGGRPANPVLGGAETPLR